MTGDTLALVESPAQLLHVLEWCHAEQSAERTALAVLAPGDPATLLQLRSMADFAEAFRAGASGALAASVFHDRRIAIADLKDYLAAQSIEVRR